MARKQVDLDLGTQALQPTAQRAGQYRVAVQQTPKTNSALQLAQALRYTPQILGQASNIAQKMGAEAALNATDVEGEMLDDETKGILGYDKAYQQGLVKRHFSMNEESIKTRFKNLASSEEFLKMDPDQFVAALQGERQQFNDELMEQFGGNGNREQAINALSSTFVDDILDSTTAEWTDNKKQQTEMFISGDAQSMFQKHGILSAGLQYMGQEFAALGMAPKERGDKMRGAVEAHIGVLVSQGKHTQAQQLLKEAGTYNIQGNGAKLFGTTEGTKKMTAMRRALQKAQQKDDESFSENSKGLGRSVDALMQDVADPDVSIEDRQASALRMATRAGVPDEQAQAFAEAASVGGIDAMMDAYRDLSRNTENENTRDLLNDQLGEINRAKKEYFGGNASSIGTFSADDISDLKDQREAILMKDPNTPLTQLPTSVNGRKMNTEDDAFKTLLRDERRDFGWATSPSQLGDITKNAKKAIRGTASKDSGFGVYASEYETTLRNDLNAEAPALWRKAKYDVAEYDDLLQKEADSLVAGYKRRAELRGSTETILDTSLSSSLKTKAENEAYKNPEGKTVEERKPRKTVRDLVSFSSDGDVSIKDVIEDRKILNGLDIKITDKRRLIQVSLMERGFPTMESFDLDLLSEAKMGFEDVKLGRPVRDEMGKAQLGYQAQQLLKESGATLKPKEVSELEKLIKDSEGAMEKWLDYGFDSLEDFIRMEEGQATWNALNNR